MRSMKTLLPERIDLVDMNVAKDNSCVDNNKATRVRCQHGWRGGAFAVSTAVGRQVARGGVGLRAMIGGRGLGYDVAVVEGVAAFGGRTWSAERLVGAPIRIVAAVLPGRPWVLGDPHSLQKRPLLQAPRAGQPSSSMGLDFAAFHAEPAHVRGSACACPAFGGCGCAAPQLWQNFRRFPFARMGTSIPLIVRPCASARALATRVRDRGPSDRGFERSPRLRFASCSFP